MTVFTQYLSDKETELNEGRGRCDCCVLNGGQ